MSLRNDILADAEAAWFDPDGLGQEVTYKVANAGTGTIITALITYGEDLAEDGRYLMEKMTATIQAADIARPANGDTITISSALWFVHSIREGNGFHWILDCVKDVRASVLQRRSGPNPWG
jgi:hypothetical protein